MTGNYSASQWRQITKRVRLAQFTFDPHWKCFICGNRFTHNACPHTLEENHEILEKIQISA